MVFSVLIPIAFFVLAILCCEWLGFVLGMTVTTGLLILCIGVFRCLTWYVGDEDAAYRAEHPNRRP